MKKLLTFIAMALPILASGITPQQADQIVQSRIPGKHQEGHCTEYALNLGNTLERMKVPYSRIHYIWWDNGKSQMHVIVWFKTSDGQGWLADNETSHPIKEDGVLSRSNALRWITAWNSPFGGPVSDVQISYITPIR